MSSIDPKQSKQLSPIKGTILLRVKIIYTCLTCFAIAALVKIIIIQVGTSGDDLRTLGEQYSFRSEKVEAARGNILSDDGRILATSIPYFELRMDFAAPGLTDSIFNANIGGLSDELSNFFKDKKPEQYKNELTEARTNGKRYYRIAPRKVNYLELQQIHKFPLICEGIRKSGFISNKVYPRIKPIGEIASRTIGFVNSNGDKLGIEGSFDDVLRGVDGLTIKQKISGNFWMPIESRLNIEPIDGFDVKTTINIELQDIVQTALRERIVEVEADWGTVVVMEVETGRIKAIANITRKRDGTLIEDYNYAVGMSQEPGSTFKLPVLLALVDDAKYSLNTMFDTERGEVHIGKAKVIDTRKGGYGKISLGEIFDHSSNIGMAKAVNRAYGDNPARFVNKIMEFGLDKEVGMQIPGEPRPTIKHPNNKKSDWDGTSLTMMSYGYALRLTPIQTLTFYNAIANNGKMMRPLLVEELIEKDVVTKRFEPEIINEQIASPQSIATVQSALRSVVNNGTAKGLKNPLYTVAAKTGTAQIARGRKGYIAADGSREYLGSIAGYFPADKPKYSMIIAFKTYYKPNSGKIYYGGALSAPLFKTIADKIYSSSYELLTPHYANEQSAPIKKYNPLQTIEIDSIGVPNVIGMSFNDAVITLEERGFGVRAKGKGKVSKQERIIDTLSDEAIIEITLSL